MVRLLLLDLGTPRNELSEPIGIEVLAGYLDLHNPEVEVTLKSIELHDRHEIQSLLSSDQFSIVGISSKIGAYARLKWVLSIIQQRKFPPIVLVGDILGTFAFPELLKLFPNIICVRGEGEQALSAICDLAAEHSESVRNLLSGVPNIAYLINSNLVTTHRTAIHSSEVAPPKRHLLPEIVNRRGIAHLEASRGCVYSHCAFCGINEKYAQTPWRPLSIHHIISQLEELASHDVNSPYFTDEDFFGNDFRRVEEFCQQISDSKAHGSIPNTMNFYFNCRIASVLGDGFGGRTESKRIFKLLHDAGLREVFIGVESGSPEQIDRYRKNLSAERSIEAILILKDNGIDLDLGFIFFDPPSTLRTLKENVDLIRKAGINNNYSRLLKKLRIEPYTPLGEAFKAQNPDAILDFNSVSYPYHFEDPQVEEIYNIFSQWESENLDFVYGLQSYCRGEVDSEFERQQIKDLIGQYRAIDFDFLSSILTAYLQRFRNTSIKSIVDNFRTRRRSLDLFVSTKFSTQQSLSPIKNLDSQKC